MRLALLLACSCALALTACGKDDEQDTAGPTATTANAAKSSPSGEGGPGVTVGMRNFAFEPAEITIKVGEQVTWRNDDTTEHNVKGQGVDDAPRTDPIEQGETYAWTAKDAGTVTYICTIHPNMVGTVVVSK
ncbi:MAG: cupredoxin domain-containing protein [Solirubrobacteraceae bacterium]|nr:cupredoxin domain-containing protein [Solirubrobacteraceae bacterium]